MHTLKLDLANNGTTEVFLFENISSLVFKMPKRSQNVFLENLILEKED